MHQNSDLKPWLTDISPEHAEGDADAFGFYVSEIDLSGSSVTINRTGVTAIVGGNNVGKSTTLREIHEALTLSPGQARTPSHILAKVTVGWEGTTADFLEWAGSTSAFVNNFSGQTGLVSAGGIVPADHIVHFRNQAQSGGPLGPIASFITHFATAKQRFDHVQPVLRRGDLNDPPTHPLHRIEQAAGLLEEFKTAAKDIFDVDLTLDRLSGNLFFRVGKPAADAPPIDNVSGEYLQQLQRLPGLHTQGDGMQSALALLLPVITATYPLILVDEPEAFLHPPQSRKLGSTLARLAHSRGIQLIVATHDRHFLTGLLDAEEVAVSVIRLSRDNEVTDAKHLDSNTLRRAWGTASLRHSNLLDGLFHKLVVIAENERDCRFYAAALEALDVGEKLQIRPHDVLFVPSAGKGNIPALARVLLASGVPVVASPDLDIVNSESSIQKLYETFGGHWADVKETYLAATAEFRTPRTRRKNRQVLEAIAGVLSAEPDAIYESRTKDDVTAALSVASEWKRVKDYGMTAFMAEYGKAQEFMNDLAKFQIVPVQVGELERFAPQVNLRKGDAWLDEALASDVHKAHAVQEHMRRILAAGGFWQDPESQ
ncbi:ATP-dependent nuclease [Arthrobacter sp. H-02-3]|uniref:ATP-dependent nuclease n=1 Tax=Arthrobacter sp. H-02-3 TaxID=2703675 RepID=UPI000DD1C7A4|nr:AAA family ATPase [Arthrobacter sp. H-02-3]PVZ56695.1 hypothetical protein C9424_10810 [Arthrobacter sp. H-02-3]